MWYFTKLFLNVKIHLLTIFNFNKLFLLEVISMATKSILKQVTIKDKKSCEKLANALDYAPNKKSKVVVAPKARTASQEDIKKMKFAVK